MLRHSRKPENIGHKEENQPTETDPVLKQMLELKDRAGHDGAHLIILALRHSG
jgi:hypothetical protein